MPKTNVKASFVTKRIDDAGLPWVVFFRLTSPCGRFAFNQDRIEARFTQRKYAWAYANMMRLQLLELQAKEKITKSGFG